MTTLIPGFDLLNPYKKATFERCPYKFAVFQNTRLVKTDSIKTLPCFSNQKSLSAPTLSVCLNSDTWNQVARDS